MEETYKTMKKQIRIKDWSPKIIYRKKCIFQGGKNNSGVKDITFLKEFHDGRKSIHWIYSESLLF